MAVEEEEEHEEEEGREGGEWSGDEMPEFLWRCPDETEGNTEVCGVAGSGDTHSQPQHKAKASV